MDVSAAVTGVPELLSAIERVKLVLTSSETATDAAQLVATAAAPNVPRDTGALASSEHVNPTAGGAVLDYGVRYALPVHTLRPWLPAAVAAAEAPILELYQDHLLVAWQ